LSTNVLIAAIIGYLFGCSSMSYYIAKLKTIDIKGRGSKNYGAANTMRLLGLRAGVLVFVHDVLKVVLAMLLVRCLFPYSLAAEIFAGAFAVLGHIFPFYLKFDGGKGFASFIGMIITLYPTYGLCLFIISCIFALVTDYVVMATLLFTIVSPILAFAIQGPIPAILILPISILILIKHKSNFKNLLMRNGAESKISAVLRKKK